MMIEQYNQNFLLSNAMSHLRLDFIVSLCVCDTVR